MTRQIVTHTSQAYVLSLNIVTQTDNGYSLQAIPIARVTSIIFAVISLLQTISRLWLKLQALPSTFLNFCEWFYLLVEAGTKPWYKTMAQNPGGAI